MVLSRETALPMQNSIYLDYKERARGKGASLTPNVVLGGAIGIPYTPVGLVRNFSVLARAHWLPWLVKGLERKCVTPPAPHATNAFLPKLFSFLNPRICPLIAATAGRPA